MRKLLAATLLFMTCFISSACGEGRPTLAVQDFVNKTSEKEIPVSAITDMMVTELNDNGIFDLIERERLEHIDDELRLARSGWTDPSAGLDMKIKNAKYTMTGSITLYYYDENGGGMLIPFLGVMSQAKTAYVTLDIRIINNETSEILYSASQVGTAKREAQETKVSYKGFSVGSSQKRYPFRRRVSCLRDRRIRSCCCRRPSLGSLRRRR